MARRSKAPFVHLAPYGQGNRHEALQIAHKRGKGKNQHRGILRKTGLITGYCRKMAGMLLKPAAPVCSKGRDKGLWGKGVGACACVFQKRLAEMPAEKTGNGAALRVCGQ